MLTFQINSFPVLETKRLVLREIKIEDANTVYELRNEPSSLEHTGRKAYAQLQEAKDLIINMENSYINSEGINWAITEKGNHKMIGSIGLWRIFREHYRAEIGYTLLQKYRNKGYVSEAINIITETAFNTLNIHRIDANVDPLNIASIRVLEKTGFIKEGYIKENYFFDGEFLDTVTFGKVKKN